MVEIRTGPAHPDRRLDLDGYRDVWKTVVADLPIGVVVSLISVPRSVWVWFSSSAA